MPITKEDLDCNQTEQGYYEQWCEDQKHDDLMLNDFQYYWDNTVTHADTAAIKRVVELLKTIAKTYDNIGFGELEEMI